MWPPHTHTLTHREKQTEINSEKQKQTERTHCLLQAQFLNSHTAICTFFPDSASELRLWEGHPCQDTSQGCCLHENIQLPPTHMRPSQCKSVRDKTRCSRVMFSGLWAHNTNHCVWLWMFVCHCWHTRYVDRYVLCSAPVVRSLGRAYRAGQKLLLFLYILLDNFLLLRLKHRFSFFFELFVCWDLTMQFGWFGTLNRPH